MMGFGCLDAGWGRGTAHIGEWNTAERPSSLGHGRSAKKKGGSWRSSISSRQIVVDTRRANPAACDSSPERAARTSIYLATSPEVNGVSGQYFTDSKKTEAKNKFGTEENRAWLWELSLQAVHIATPARVRHARS